jgi:hypothetical protein
MQQWLLLILTLGAMALTIIWRAFFLRRVNQDRADPVIDPSWPSTARPMPNRFPEPPPRAETSLYYDPSERNG